MAAKRNKILTVEQRAEALVTFLSERFEGGDTDIPVNATLPSGHRLADVIETLFFDIQKGLGGGLPAATLDLVETLNCAVINNFEMIISQESTEKHASIGECVRTLSGATPKPTGRF